MVKSAAGSTPLAYSSPKAVQTTGTIAVLRDDVPFRGRGAKLVIEPILLRVTEIGAARLEPFRATGIGNLLAAALGRVVAGEARAVLAGVENKETGQRAVVAAAIEPHVRPLRHCRQRQRHVLPIGAIRRPPRQ